MLGLAVRRQGSPYRADGFQPGGDPGTRPFGEPVGLSVGGPPADPGCRGVIGEFSRGARDLRLQVGEQRRGLFQVSAGTDGRLAAPGELGGGLGGGPLVGTDEPLQVGELFDRLVGGGGLQLVEPGARSGESVLRLLQAGSRLRLFRFGACQGRDVARELGAPLRAGFAAAGDRVGSRPGVGAQIGGVGA